VIGGCGSEGSHGPSAEAVGTLQADLVTKGPNGDTYQIPSGFSLAIAPTSAPDAGSTLFFDPTTTQTSDTFSIPAGTYTVRLLGGPPWQLLDVTANKTVNVNLLDTQPYSLTIVAGQTVSLPIHFALQGVGNVTFGTGMLATSISLADAAADAGAPSTGNFWLQSGVSQINPVGASANTSIKSLMTQGSPVLFTLPPASFRLGPWIPGIDTVCSAVTLPAGYKWSSDVLPDGGATGNMDLMTEAMAPGGTVQLCFGDQNIYPGASSTVEIIFQRTGAATMTSVKTALASYAGVPTFAFFALGTPVFPADSGAPPAYNGSVAAFSYFLSAVTMTVQYSEIDFDPGAADEVAVIGGPGAGGLTTANSTMTLQLLP
jgi:hypothetical protein